MNGTDQAVRSCGGCTACCFTHGVNELKKYELNHCMHCDAGRGCRIYEERPDSCRSFKCAWLEGFGQENDRPDRVGVASHWSTVRFTDSDPLRLVLFETHAKALARGRGREFLLSVLSQGIAVKAYHVSAFPMIQFHLSRSPQHETFGRMLIGRGYKVNWYDAC